MDRRGTVAIALGLALHLAIVGFVVWLSVHRTPSGAAPDGTIADAVTRAEPEAALPPARRPEPAVDDIGRYLPHPPPLDFWGFRADVAKVRARWDALFPFVTAPVTVAIEAAAKPVRASATLAFVDQRRVPMRPLRPRPALAMSPAALQAVVDRSWTRRERWARFAEIAALIDRYDPDDGRLPDLVRAYVEQNLMQPYEDASFPDPRRWIMLVLAADDRDYVDFALAYVRAHPRTRTATELLFLIDAVMQGSGNALELLLQTDPRRDLGWTAHENPEAWALFDAVHDYYAERLRVDGTATIPAIRRRYDAQRVTLLTSVLRLAPDGYRAGDAHFAIGRIRWTQGDRVAALREWRQIRADHSDAFAASYAPILTALAADPSERIEPATVARIEAAFQAERRRWAAFHDRRLARFGYAASMF